MLNVILCAYRDWAIEINNYIAQLPKINCVKRIHSKTEFDAFIKDIAFYEIDFMLFVGWSWIIPEVIICKYLCLGIHPSDLPAYRGGSPIQHQIINGITQTKITLMELSAKKIDAGDIYAKEEVSLDGNTMSAVFRNIVDSSKRMLEKFINNYTSIVPQKQDILQGSYYARRKPSDSKLDRLDFNEMSLKSLYNFMRALTDPYPNAYLEDEKGNRLIFKEVEYIDALQNK
jgi:methionyl-tRNA formyltransferase